MEADSEVPFLKQKIKEEVIITRDNNLAESPFEEKISWLFDLRNITLQPAVLGIIARQFWRHNPDLDNCQIGGLETASIPIIAAVLLEGEKIGKNVTAFYIRKSRKKTGMVKNIEGVLTDKPAVLVDDLINTGSSFMRQVLLLEKEGITVTRVFTVVRFREQDEYSELVKRNIKISSIFTLPDFSMNFLRRAPSETNVFQFDKYFKTSSASHLDVIPKSEPVLYKDKIIWTTDNGHIWCLSPDTLEPIWHIKVGLFSKQHFFTVPFIKNDILYAFSKTGNVYHVDLLKGKVIFYQSVAETIVASPLLLTDSTAVVCSIEGVRSSIIAYDFVQRKVVWTQSTPAPVLGTGVVAEGTFVVLDEKGFFYVGNELGVTSKFSSKGEKIYTRGNLEVCNNTKDIAWTTMDGRIFITNIKSKKTWPLFQTDAGIYNKVLVVGPTLFAGSLDKNVYAIDMATKKLLWKFETKGRVFSSPVIREGVLLIGANDSCLYALNPETGNMIDKYQTTERITTAVVLFEQKKLLLTTFANEIYKLSVK